MHIAPDQLCRVLSCCFLSIYIVQACIRIVSVIEDAKRHVEYVGRLVVGTIPLLVLCRIEQRKRRRDFVEASPERLQGREGRDRSRTKGLFLRSIDHVRQITDGRLSTRRFTSMACFSMGLVLKTITLTRDQDEESMEANGIAPG